ncbi:TetR/AcrR family transcriptional regulator [uncultured Tateyamaria sp.]|uniref:TetR/AcrR family transcriptional regulator n=1 Tax=uncultured Tateyamaria sp. TaxID=455651 RepID=UPI00261372D9|nr:TetR/AcrR family transcriptional regulator [uncultured Tateyamaria sp.]
MTKDINKRRRRKDARPSEIIAAAFGEFEDKGFGGTTLGSIAARAGISRTTIYLYFDTKEAIFEAAMRGSVEQTIDAAAMVVQQAHGDFRTVFSHVVDMIYARLVTGDASVLLRVLVAEGHEMQSLVALYRHEILSKGESTIRALIERGIAAGELAEEARSYDVRLLVSPAIFVAIWMRVFAQVEPLEVDAFKASHIKLVCDALIQSKA